VRQKRLLYLTRDAATTHGCDGTGGVPEQGVSVMRRVVIVGIAGLAAAIGAGGTAYADQGTAGDADGAGPGAASQGAVVAQPGSAWPQQVILRPLTLPGGALAGGVGFEYRDGTDSSALGLAASYGISSRFEAGGAYSFPLFVPEPTGDDLEVASGVLALRAGYAAVRGAADGAFTIVGRGSIGLHLEDGGQHTVGVGAQARYNLSDQLAIVSSGDNLAITLTGDDTQSKPMTVAVPLGVGFQATANLYAQLDTRLLTFGLNDDASTTLIFANSTPLVLTAAFSPSNAMDFSAGIGLDVTPEGDVTAGDTLRFLASFAYYAGVD
jgi:hypothetical protein